MIFLGKTVRSCVGAIVVNSDYVFMTSRQNYKEGISWDQQFFVGSGIKISSLLGSRIKILGKNMGSAIKKYTSLRPCYSSLARRLNTTQPENLMNEQTFLCQFLIFIFHCW